MTIEPTSWLGVVVLLTFSVGMLLIVFEAKLHMDKFKPALFMLTALPLIGIYYWASGGDPRRVDAFI